MMNQLWGGIAQLGSNDAAKWQASAGSLSDYIQNTKRMNRQQDALTSAQGRTEDLMNELTAMYDPYTSQGQEAWGQLQTEYEGLRGRETPEFDMSQVQKYLDPSMDFQMGKANEALAARQAGGGDWLSGAGQAELMEQNRQMAQTGFGDAYNKGYQQYRDKLQADQADLATRLNLLQNMSNTGLSATGAQAGIKGQYGDQLNNLGLTKGFLGAEQSTLKHALAGDLMQQNLGQASADMSTIGNMLGAQGSGNKQQYGLGQQPSQGYQGVNFGNLNTGAGVNMGNVGGQQQQPTNSFAQTNAGLNTTSQGMFNFGGL